MTVVHSATMRISTWNLERKKPRSLRGAEAVDYLHGLDADVSVLTEVRTGFPPNGGHMAFAGPPVGEWFDDDERKVGVWSARPAEVVEFDSPIDRSRFVAVRTDTPIGCVVVLGVCIPWHMAGVTHRTGPVRSPWELHLVYLAELAKIMRALDEPFVVAGDFNQRYPRVKYSNRRAAETLDAAFEGVDIVTAGTISGCERPGIDHIAVNSSLVAAEVRGWRNDVTGNRLSDHDGAWADISVSR